MKNKVEVKMKFITCGVCVSCDYRVSVNDLLDF